MCKRSSIMTNILNNNQSLSASRNNSFCTRASIGTTQATHAKRIAQLLLGPTGSLLPSNDCSSCPPRRESTISEMVCVCFYPISFPFAISSFSTFHRLIAVIYFIRNFLFCFTCLLVKFSPTNYRFFSFSFSTLKILFVIPMLIVFFLFEINLDLLTFNFFEVKHTFLSITTSDYN